MHVHGVLVRLYALTTTTVHEKIVCAVGVLFTVHGGDRAGGAGRHAPSPRSCRSQLGRCASVLTTSDTEVSTEIAPLERALTRPYPRQQLLQERREVNVERWGGVTGVRGSELHELTLRGTQSSHDVDAIRWRAWAVNSGCSCVLCCVRKRDKCHSLYRPRGPS